MKTFYVHHVMTQLTKISRTVENSWNENSSAFILNFSFLVSRQEAFRSLDSESRSDCKSHKKSVEAHRVQRGGSSHSLRYPGGELLWSRRPEWDICKGVVPRSVLDVPRLRSEHKSHRWSNNSRANRSYDEGDEEGRSHKSELRLHPPGFNHFLLSAPRSVTWHSTVFHLHREH